MFRKKPLLFSQISIHAPTWGATFPRHRLRRASGHFNPRTHVGCDACELGELESTLLFQSTHPRGVRPVGPVKGVAGEPDISIHAPTWGATRRSRRTRTRFRIFQSTHPRGVRRPRTSGTTTSFYFNPRTHVGCDTTYNPASDVTTIFQSTHPRGVRHVTAYQIAVITKFQSTHPRGVRL